MQSRNNTIVGEILKRRRVFIRSQLFSFFLFLRTSDHDSRLVSTIYFQTQSRMRSVSKRNAGCCIYLLFLLFFYMFQKAGRPSTSTSCFYLFFFSSLPPPSSEVGLRLPAVSVARGQGRAARGPDSMPAKRSAMLGMPGNAL